VVVEYVFRFPGIGQSLVDGVANRDLPVVQAAILLIALIMVLSNLMVDFIHAAIDPRAEIFRGRGQ
jgi:peptide/nickel transport system permease protein